MRQVAITGATGFIGWHVARLFQEEGWRVRAIVRPESHRSVPDGVERVTASLVQSEIVAIAEGVELIVHLAAVVGARSDEEFQRSNVAATREVAHAARTLGSRLIHASSLGATGPGSPEHPPAETDPTRPVNAYGRSKLQSEMAVKAVEGLNWTILRPSLVYGPRDRLFLPLFALARRGFFPVPNLRSAYNLIHVHDVARCVLHVANADSVAQEIFFVGGQEQVTAREVMARLAAVFNRPFHAITVPRIALRAVAEFGSLASAVGVRIPLNRDRWKELDAPGFVCRTDKARDRLGFVAKTDLNEGLRQTADWYQRNRWL